MDALKRQQRGPAPGAQRLLQRLGIRTEGWELPVTKAQHRHRHLTRLGGLDASQGGTGVCRRLPFPIGGGQHKHLSGGGSDLKVLQGAGVHPVTALGQRIVQRLGKAPGAPPFAGHEDEHIGLRERSVAGDPGCLAPGLPPDDHPRDPEQQHTGTREAEHHGPGPGRFAGVQHHGQVIDTLGQAGILPGQHLARVAVDPSLSLDSVHLPGVLRVGRRGKAELSQIPDRQILQGGHLRCRHL